jgi:histidine triad (HIT) family protein
MAETIFSKIIRGEIPCHRVYEDTHVLAFLDINPLCEGHTLVIPKEAVATIDQLSDEAAAAIGRVLPRISRAVLQATGATEFNILQNNGPGAHQPCFMCIFTSFPSFRTGEGSASVGNQGPSIPSKPSPWSSAFLPLSEQTAWLGVDFCERA